MVRLTVPNIGVEECEAVQRVLRSGQLVHGEECELFEQELACYLDCKEVVVVSSGTAALHLALVALGIGQGDAVIVPDFTFAATANVVELVGARPIFVDVDLKTYNITPENISRAISEWQGKEKIRAIMPVHEFGCPVDMSAITKIANEYGLLVIEDAACALGTTHLKRKVGTFGEAGCFSFHPRKALTTGEGGAIATNNSDLAHRLRILRNHGIFRKNEKVDFILAGYNYRMTNFQAALGRVQLPKFDGWLRQRKVLQSVYRNNLIADKIYHPEEIDGHSWQTFMVRLDSSINRDEIIAKLREGEVEANFGAQALHLLSYYREKYFTMSDDNTDNNSETLYRSGLAIPLYQGLSVEQITFVCKVLLELL